MTTLADGHFEYGHLPSHLQGVSMLFANAAWTLEQILEPGPEKSTALRKLLEAKDAAVRQARLDWDDLIAAGEAEPGSRDAIGGIPDDDEVRGG